MLLQHCFKVFTNLEVNSSLSSRGLMRLNPLIDHGERNIGGRMQGDVVTGIRNQFRAQRHR